MDLNLDTVCICTAIIIGIYIIYAWAQRISLRKRIEKHRAEEAQRKVEEAKRLEAQRKAEEAKRLEAQRKAEEAKRQEALRKTEEAKRQEALRKAEEAKRQEAQRKAEEAKRQEALRKVEEAKRQEAQRKAEEAKRQEALRKAEEEKIREAQRKAEEVRTQMCVYLEKNDIRYFYHFTAEANKTRIEQLGGLYSWAEMERQGHSIPVSGGGDLSRRLDSRFGLQDYVRLSFCKDHPMAFRLHKEGHNLILLKFDALAMIEAGLLDNAIFSDMNATDNNHQKDLGIEGLHLIDIKATQRSYVARTDPDFKYHQAEVMIRRHIPYDYILSVENMSFNQSGRGEYISIEHMSDEQKKVLETLGLL